MARTLAEITQLIEDAKDTFPALVGLNSPSAVSSWHQLRDTFAVNLYLHELQVDILKAEINRLADEAASGNDPWVQRKMLQFQFGSVAYVTEDLVVKYPVIDISQRIITRCSVRKSDTT